jgi:hypothetical protein
VYSKQNVDFFCGSTPSSRKATTGLLSIIAYVIHLFNIQVEGLYELEEAHLGEFAPLISAARGEPVRLPELKKAAIKATELILEELNVGA